MNPELTGSAGQWTWGLILSSHPQYRDYSHTPPTLSALFVGAGIQTHVCVAFLTSGLEDAS